MESAITSKGQATIPKAVREYLGLQTGDRVKFFFHADGSVVLLPIRPVAALRGMIARGKHAVPVGKMERVAQDAAIARTVRRNAR